MLTCLFPSSLYTAFFLAAIAPAYRPLPTWFAYDVSVINNIRDVMHPARLHHSHHKCHTNISTKLVLYKFYTESLGSTAEPVCSLPARYSAVVMSSRLGPPFHCVRHELQLLRTSRPPITYKAFHNTRLLLWALFKRRKFFSIHLQLTR